jgi:hypothetical protein
MISNIYNHKKYLYNIYKNNKINFKNIQFKEII